MIDSNLLRDLVRALGKSVGTLEKREMLCCGVTIGQCYAILEIGLAEDISLIDLANLLNLDKSTMSRTVNNLVNHGLVDRIIDAENRRYVKLKLTEHGKEAFDKINETFSLFLDDIFNNISESKRAQMLESLEILISALKNYKFC